LILFITIFIVQSCKQKTGKVAAIETPSSGTAKFAADESFQPIINQELEVFKHLNSRANLEPVYGTENDVLRLLLNDSVRFAILSRDLNADEKKIMAGRKLVPVVNRIAIDAIALIVNQASKDTLITVNEIKKMLAGQNRAGTNIVFDNPNSSIVRYLKSFSGVNDFKQRNIYALKDNKEVIKYVDQHQNSIGIIGLNWLDDAPGTDYADAVKNVKVMAVRDESSKTAPNQYFTPSQNTLSLKQYPLSRGLYIINCTGKVGLNMGFAHFILSARGQMIILRSNLLADSIPERVIQIKHTY